jgi:hypothetical protein
MKTNPRITPLAFSVAAAMASNAQAQATPQIGLNPAFKNDKHMAFANFEAAGGALKVVEDEDGKATTGGVAGHTYTGYHVAFDGDKPIVTLFSRPAHHANTRANLQPGGVYMSIGGAKVAINTSKAGARMQ